MGGAGSELLGTLAALLLLARLARFMPRLTAPTRYLIENFRPVHTNIGKLVASSKAIDPGLDALFSQSAGAVKPPPKSRYAELLPPKEEEIDEEDSENANISGDESEEEAGVELEAGSSEGDKSTGEEELEGEGDSDASSGNDETEAAELLERAVSHSTSQDQARKRKRRQQEDDEDLEANYFERLANEEEPSGKRLKQADPMAKAGASASSKGDGEESSSEKTEDDESGDDVPVHESIAADPVASELEKANRTVFLSNVSVEAVTSRTAKKTLLSHLASILDKKANPPQKVQSIRFRSTAFETAGIPKRAAYIKKSVMEATTKSTNAYAVYSTPAAARLAVSQLNGTVVLDRHLRVDSVAHPSPIDHRRCVFVGNLGFVDDETVYAAKLNEEGKEVTEKRKRTKTPMDVEEGLWRVFGEKAGKVESVRVVRDAATRVGKGFAYVQFYDGNAVESAILLNEKKFPPMLPRALRVNRCKAPHKTAKAMEARRDRTATTMSAFDRRGGNKKGNSAEDGAAKSDTYVPKPTVEGKTLAGRASKLLGRFGAAKLVGEIPGGKDKKHRDRRNRGMNNRGSGMGGSAAPGGAGAGEVQNGFRGPEQFVFEGRRASARDGKPKDLKFKKGKAKGAPKKKRSGNVGKYGKA
ncbi:hypothetical protein N658DRAFT_535328 [Parathielavia hyrcaniae]|uniref:Nucleolar protein 12 n=1 Tax=Parathielavia hyrcaniae TaxID=113614 RepID=A0AAN6T1B3_9PEZI|nr:hypothetical protein N658DRAFT_535328 [Parathielavia hyrcaniae]